MAKGPKFYVVYSFLTSPDLRYHTTSLVKHRSSKSLLNIQCVTEFCAPIQITVQDNLLNC